MTDPFAALADPVRRYVLELLSGGERSAGELVDAVRERFGLAQPTVSQHLAVLRGAGLVDVRAQGSRRIYATRSTGLNVVAAWLDAVTPDFAPALDALATEVARGKRDRRSLWTDAAPAPDAAHEPARGAAHEPARGAAHEPARGAAHEPARGDRAS
ncbi:MAG: metalloregulator ArsR/SmtB family transcription factor [Kineosporiaceae bacterium]